MSESGKVEPIAVQGVWAPVRSSPSDAAPDVEASLRILQQQQTLEGAVDTMEQLALAVLQARGVPLWGDRESGYVACLTILDDPWTEGLFEGALATGRRAAAVLFHASLVRHYLWTERVRSIYHVHKATMFYMELCAALHPPGRSLGAGEPVFWADAWLTVSPLEARMLRFMAGRADADVDTFVRACWADKRQRLYQSNRSRVDKALSTLNGKLLNHNPPICQTLGIRGDRIVVERQTR